MPPILDSDRARQQKHAIEALQYSLGTPPSLFIIVGAGVSIATTYGTTSPAPGWNQLLKKCCLFAKENVPSRQHAILEWIEHTLDDPRATIDEYTSAAQELERILGLDNFRDFLTAEFRPLQRLEDRAFREHPLYQQLMTLRQAGARIITVNYDTLLEIANGLQSIDWMSDNFEVNRFFQERDPVPDKYVLHLHGRWNSPTSVIFGTTSYNNICAEGSANRDKVMAIRARLQSVFAEKHVLFVGCGNTTSDPHFATIFEEYKKSIHIPERRHVYLCTDDDFRMFESQLPRHIVPLPYGSHGDLVNAFPLLFPSISFPLAISAGPVHRPGVQTAAGSSAQPNIIGEQSTRPAISSGGTIGDGYEWTERDRQCLEDLRLSDPRHDKKRIERISGGLLEASYEWILQNNDFQLWRDHRETRLLWIKGDPGKGKTMLLCGIINHLRMCEQSLNKSTLLAFFFCQATDSRLNTFTAVLRGLIYMLVDQRPGLIRYVRDKYDRAGKSLFTDTNSWVALSEILPEILRDPDLPIIYLVIDALDECLTDRPQLLDFIVATSMACPTVKCLISSRNIPDIEKGLGAGPGIRLSLELNEDSVKHAVDAYIRHKVPDGKKFAETAAVVRQYLFDNSSGTFLWVSAVCKELDTSLGISVTKKNYPPGLDALYERMIEQVFESVEAEACKLVLSVATIVYRPITLDEFKAVVKIDGLSLHDSELWREIIRRCGSFLTIRDDTVYFVHQSAKDFLLKSAPVLLKNTSERLFPEGVDKVHRTILSTSLEVLSETLERDIYGLGDPGFCITDIKRPDPDPLASKRIDDLSEDGKVHRFLKLHFLHWLEALSIFQSVYDGMLAIAKLENLVVQQEMSEDPQLATGSLVKLIRDARRFVMHFKGPIALYPLQAYETGLVFSPARSVIKRIFKKEEPPWLKNQVFSQHDWDSCLQTLEGHEGVIRFVALSHDSSTIASASSDLTIKLWDSSSGRCINTFHGHTDEVNAVAWSPDSKHVISASSDKTIKIWDVAMGGPCSQTLESHDSSVNAVAVSHDAKYIASASDDCTVVIWDWDTERCRRYQTLREHSAPTYSVAFSHDSQLVASASLDTAIKIWHIYSGQCHRTLAEHILGVRSVTFSHDSRYLASGSHDKTSKIWDTDSGRCLHTIKGHMRGVDSVAFSPDSKSLASASLDKTVKIWNVDSGRCLQTLRGHTSWCTSVAFSRDSKCVVSGSWDATLKIWHTDGGQGERIPEGHMHSITSVIFSRELKYVASGSFDFTIRIWDASNGRCLRMLEGHHSGVNSVAFSHDSKLLVSTSFDSTVKIWDLGSGRCLHTIKGEDKSSWAVFSHDSKMFATASDWGTVRIWHLTWDVGKTICLQSKNLVRHKRRVTSVAFSSDSRYLASTSTDGTVKIWNVDTGECIRSLEHDVESSLHVTFGDSDHAKRSHFGDVVLSKLPSVAAAGEIEYRLSVRRGFGISPDGAWVQRNAKNVLWLPHRYRSAIWTVRGSSICIGGDSGHILVFEFDDALFPEQSPLDPVFQTI